MTIREIINIIAMVVAPIIAVIIGQYLQDRKLKRADKMEIFKTLMISRGIGWSVESVKALNIIEIVFSDDKNVIQQWKAYYDKLCVENPSETELSKIKTEGEKLLDTMAKSLGYKDKVTWETIQKPYIPKGMIDTINLQQQYYNTQYSVLNSVNSMIQNKDDSGEKKNG